MRNLTADLARYGASGGPISVARALLRHQQTWALVDYRFGVWARSRAAQPLIAVSSVLHRIVEITTGISISPRARIGPGLLISHFGGIIVGPAVRIGIRCSLGPGVVIGQATDDGPSPEIGDGVTISAGAKVFGGISIGRQAVIGANAVVNEDIPDFAVAVGVPARVVKVQGVRTDGRVSSSPR